MTNIRVVATVTYDFDTEDGLVTTKEEALQHVRDFINEGDVGSGSFEYEVTEASHSGTPEPETADNEERGDICMALREAGFDYEANEVGGYDVEGARSAYQRLTGRTWRRMKPDQYKVTETSHSVKHEATLLSGQVTCSCGWVSKHSAMASDAVDDWQVHRLTARKGSAP